MPTPGNSLEDLPKDEFLRAGILILNTSLFICDADHDASGEGDMADSSRVAQSKRKIVGQQAIPTTHSNKQVAAERGNTGPRVQASHRLLQLFPSPAHHFPKSASALSGNSVHLSLQEWLPRHVRFCHNK